MNGSFFRSFFLDKYVFVKIVVKIGKNRQFRKVVGLGEVLEVEYLEE